MQRQSRSNRVESSLNKKERRQARDRAAEAQRRRDEINFISTENGLWEVQCLVQPNERPEHPPTENTFRRQTINLNIPNKKTSGFNLREFLDDVKAAITSRKEAY